MVTAACLLLAVSACSAGKPTPIQVHVTLPPLITAQVTPTAPGATPTDTPTPTPTAAATASGPTASPTAIGSVAPTPIPIATPTGLAGGCSGSDANKTWWAAESKKLSFAVYCAVVSGGWYFASATDTYNNGGTMTASYKGPGGAVFTIQQGAFCTTSAAACSPHTAVLGSANFGDKSGTLDATSTGRAIYVGPGTAQAYTATGANISQSAFVNLAAALMKVPKS
jgi:hypothetical protein